MTRPHSIRRSRAPKAPVDSRCPCSKCRALDAAHPREGYQLALPVGQPEGKA